MLKKRVAAFLPIRDGIVVQSIGFSRYLPVGSPRIAVEYLNAWGIDEIVMVDISASAEGRCIDPALVRDVSIQCHVPLAVGGGVRTIDQMKNLLHSGADKIVLNEAAIHDPKLLQLGAERFGAQCMIQSIDVRATEDGNHEAFIRNGSISTGCGPREISVSAMSFGAGEILLNSIDRDGSGRGLDMSLIESVADAVTLPLVICGGIGQLEHFREGLENESVSGVAAGNFFHFWEHSVTLVKSFLRAKTSCPVRLDTYATYDDHNLDEAGRLLRKDDAALEKLFYEYHPKEVI